MRCFQDKLNNKRNIKGHTARSDSSLKCPMWYNLSNALEASMYNTYVDEWHVIKYLIVSITMVLHIIVKDSDLQPNYIILYCKIILL